MDPITIVALVNGTIAVMDAINDLNRTVSRRPTQEFVDAERQLRGLAVERARKAARRAEQRLAGEFVEPIPDEFVERAHSDEGQDEAESPSEPD